MKKPFSSLFQKGNAAPARERVVSDDEQKQMMAYYYKKQQELKVTEKKHIFYFNRIFILIK
jgi:hypothetical protein